MDFFKRYDKNFFLYGGISYEDYKKIENFRNNTNCAVWRAVSKVCVVYFLLLAFIALMGNTVSENIKIYIFMAIVSALCSFILENRKNIGDKYALTAVYIMVFGLLFFSVYIGAIVTPDYLSVTFPVLLMVIPLFMMARPYRTGLINLGMTIVFIVLVAINKTGNNRSMDIFNAIGFCLLSQIVCLFTARYKMRSALLMDQIAGISMLDELTKFPNRRSFEDDCKKIAAGVIPVDQVIVSMDLNGLKTVNDSLGHEAGDELILAAAECMKNCFGGYGQIYRTGGDEFMALLNIDLERFKLLLTNFESSTERWEGKYVKSVSVSYGYVSATEMGKIPLSEMVKISDKRMYQAKSEYYSKKGVDRRGQRDAFDALCASYVKILKVNLTNDTYQTVSARAEIEVAERNYSKDSVSQYLRDVAKGNAIHPEDVDNFLEMTTIESMRNFFAHNNKEILSIFYRRQIEGEYRQSIMQIIPANDFAADALHAFLYVKDIGRR